ncbi:MAG: DEAD/DEAH box helicase, partial [Alphaproteobacteria bacterium]|nr:DEAD/DEAH box helicase [Alphaproteobacteria bacterium]
LIGTPGRLVDHLNRNSFDPYNLRVVVLDEADEMLDMGFREDLETLLKAAPEQRRTLMFSATVPKTIAALARRYQRDAVRVETASEEEQHQDIAYQACSVRPSDRQNAIINLLRFHDDKKAVIFCATRASVSYLATRLANRGLSVVALSGELNQAARNQAMQAMRDGRARVCVATDVAARGIDLPNLDLVIHADLPRTPDVLLHRSGRTGRAGRKGTAIIVVPDNIYRKTQKLLQLAGITADWVKAPDADNIRARDDERILQNADLTAQPDEKETELQNQLTASFSAEQLALALIRQHRCDLTAPEELGEAGDMNMAGEMKTYRWFSLSAGKGQDIRVRGLLSLLSGRGGVKSSDVGDIYLHHSESHVAIAEQALSSFLGRLKDGHLTDDIEVTKIDSPIIPEGRPKANRRQKKPSFGKKRLRRSYSWRPDDRTGRVERSSPKSHE